MELPSGLTVKQARFAAEYTVDWNGTQAALRAGYGHDAESACAIASELLRKPQIATAIVARRQELDDLATIASLHVRARSLRSVERLERMADMDPDGSTDRRLQVAFQANVKLLEGAGVLRSGGAQVVIDNRRIDVRAMELWQQGGAAAWRSRRDGAAPAIPEAIAPAADESPLPSPP